MGKKTIKEISEIISQKLNTDHVVYADIIVDNKGIGHLRFDAYDKNGYKTHEVSVDSKQNYKIKKI